MRAARTTWWLKAGKSLGDDSSKDNMVLKNSKGSVIDNSRQDSMVDESSNGSRIKA